VIRRPKPSIIGSLRITFSFTPTLVPTL